MKSILVHLSKVENLEKSYKILDAQIEMFGYRISFKVSDIFLPKSETTIKQEYDEGCDSKSFVIPEWLYNKILKEKIEEVRINIIDEDDRSDFKYLLQNIDKVTLAQGYGNLWGIGYTYKGFAKSNA